LDEKLVLKREVQVIERWSQRNQEWNNLQTKVREDDNSVLRKIMLMR